MKKKHLTLCIIHEHPRVLLGMKKRGFGEGRWNGFGGKVKDEESIEEAVQRELKEEAGITVNIIEKRGVLHFHQPGGEEVFITHVYKGQDIIGEPKESEEMRPEWFHHEEIPLADMWPDDEYWIPLFLKDAYFHGEFHFDEDDRIVTYELSEVDPEMIQ